MLACGVIIFIFSFLPILFLNIIITLDVPAWLKSLRLHKYLSLFAQLTYDEMLNLNEEWLATQGVTKGARHKIILSIRKLRERHVTLCQLEKDVVAGGNLVSALDELKTILLSPIRPEERDETAGASLTDVNDIPTQFTKVMGKGKIKIMNYFSL